jgi:hypothetical protein
LGGARIQVADEALLLPIVDAVGKVDTKIKDVIKRHGGLKVAEACGLWNSREVAGLGYSFFMLRAAIALAYQLKVNILYALAAPVTVQMCLNAGFIIEKTLGKDGFFNYPKLDLVATAMLIDDLKELKAATNNDREHILKLIEEPDQLMTATGPKGDTLIDYRLSIKRDVI